MKLQERLEKAESVAMEAFERTLLFIEGVTVSFDGFKALNNLSFAIAPTRRPMPLSTFHKRLRFPWAL
jgi:hypothetical protein